MPQPESQPTGLKGSAALVRGLGTWDGALLTIGSIVGTGIFITTADMAQGAPPPRADPAGLARGRAADARRSAHLCRARRHVPARRRALPLRPRGVRAALGVPLRVDGLPGHHVGRDRRARGRLRRVPGELPAVLLHRQRPALPARRPLDLEALRRAGGGGARDPGPHRRQPPRPQGGGLGAERADGDQDRRDRALRGAGPAGAGASGAGSLRTGRHDSRWPRRPARRLRGGDDRGALDLRRLVRPHLLGGRDARSRAQPPPRADPRHGGGDAALPAAEPRLRPHPGHGRHGGDARASRRRRPRCSSARERRGWSRSPC